MLTNVSNFTTYTQEDGPTITIRSGVFTVNFEHISHFFVVNFEQVNADCGLSDFFFIFLSAFFLFDILHLIVIGGVFLNIKSLPHHPLPTLLYNISFELPLLQVTVTGLEPTTT